MELVLNSLQKKQNGRNMKQRRQHGIDFPILLCNGANYVFIGSMKVFTALKSSLDFPEQLKSSRLLFDFTEIFFLRPEFFL